MIGYHKTKSEDLDLREGSCVLTHGIEDLADWGMARNLLPANYQLKLVGHQHNESNVVVEEMSLVVPTNMKKYLESGALRLASSEASESLVLTERRPG